MKRRKEDFHNQLNTTDTTINPNILHLMQIHDSAFPIGAYTHSFGMETFIQKGSIHNRETLLSFCKTYLQANLACGDGIIVKLAYLHTKQENLEALRELDFLCNSMKVATESRNGSMRMGRQFLQTLSNIEDGDLFSWWNREVIEKRTKGHFAVTYGIYAALLDIPLSLSISTFFYSSVSSLIHNAVRAIPLGQTDGVKAIHSLLDDFQKTAHHVLQLTEDDLANNSIGIELASMEHQFLFSRLFIS
ncbi:urease accessory protein UreF [Alkalihalobacterium elongatum]|uniref:urease accessory protein UreF n=1 Tax=Alkalihalobacterium elongatum TaxID=2675466 RepID=UPI001F2E7818|nr:urease accessory protein UreF [Alkalihalobacterium elongatum]